MKRFLAIICIALLPEVLFALTPSTATQRKAAALDAPGGLFECCSWGILAVNQKGDTIAKLNHKRRLTPASNMKLITTGAALLTLGPNYRFNTTLATDGTVRDSILCGNLYIIGGGDPLIGNLFGYLPPREEPFGKWRKILENNGISRIDGRIVGNGTRFDDTYHEAWTTEDFASKDGVVPSGLTWRGKMEDSLPDGPLAAAMHFKEWLNLNGITVEGLATDIQSCPWAPPADSLTVLGSAASAPLRTIVSVANHRSDNFCAETLLKAISSKNTGYDDYEHATAALHRALSPLGLAAASKKMRFSDGSGLSRKNFLSPDFIVRFLCAMTRTKVWQDFRASLPLPGRADGTLKARLPKAPASVKNRIRMKSGTLGGARCFSGYIDPSDGNNAQSTIVFSIMVNNYVGPSADIIAALDDLILSLAQEN